MIDAAHRHHGFKAVYLNCDVAPAALADAVRGARARGWAGFNCSIPHKIAVIKHVDRRDQSAVLIGAVNCVIRRNGRWVGANADGQGFLAALRTVVDTAGKSLVVLGGGGAARAIAIESALAGAASVTIVNRNSARGMELVRALKEHTHVRAELDTWDRTYSVPEATDIVVNATSVGLLPDGKAKLDLDPDSLGGGMAVADVIPNPPRTQLLCDAQARGACILDGLGMLVNQAAISISHWTGLDADRAVMRDALEEVFARQL